MPFDDEVVGEGSAACRSTAPDSGQRLTWGLSEAEVVALLEQTPPDPAAVPFMDLDPAERYPGAITDR